MEGLPKELFTVPHPTNAVGMVQHIHASLHATMCVISGQFIHLVQLCVVMQTDKHHTSYFAAPPM